MPHHHGNGGHGNQGDEGLVDKGKGRVMLTIRWNHGTISVLVVKAEWVEKFIKNNKRLFIFFFFLVSEFVIDESLNFFVFGNYVTIIK